MNISVIIPVYNVAPYIERCLRSIMQQTFTDGVECILVNDCTPDDSIEIVQSLIAEYEGNITFRIVSHDYNKGLAAARNMGLSVAQGIYILHVDSDDYCELNMLEELYKEAIRTNADIVCCNYWEETSTKSIAVQYAYTEETWNLVIENALHALNSAVWNKLIKRELYTRYGIQNFNGINMWEDVGVTLRLRVLSKKTVIVPKALYHYNKQNMGSITASRKIAHVEEQIRCARLLEEWFSKNIDVKKNWPQLMDKVKFLAKSSLVLYPDIQDVQRWIVTFPETNSHVWRYTQFSIITRFSMWMILHGMKKMGIFCINIKYYLASIRRK